MYLDFPLNSHACAVVVSMRATTAQLSPRQPITMLIALLSESPGI